MNEALLDASILILIFGIVALGLDLIVGYTRIFSMNQALLFGVGAFSYSFCVKTLGTSSLLLALAIAVSLAAGLSAIVAFISLRVSGDHFLVASFSMQLIGVQVLYNWQDISGGASGVFGLPYPTIWNWQPVTLLDYFLLTFVVAASIYAVVAFLLISPYGRLVRALGQDERALAASGFNPLSLKVGTFVLSGALAAIAGTLYAGYNGIAQVADYSLDVSVLLLAMVIVGGAGRIAGGVLGAGILVELPRLLDGMGISSTAIGPTKQVIFGALLLVVIFFLPLGITGAAARIWSSRGSRFRARPTVPEVDPIAKEFKRS